MRILVRAPNWLGDAVMALPALRALQGALPEASITVLARQWVAALFRQELYVERVIVCAEPRGLNGWPGEVRVARLVREGRYDWALVLPNSFESALVPWLAGIPRRTGYNRHGRGLLLSEAIAFPERGAIPLHESYQYLELLRRAGVIAALPDRAPLLLASLDNVRNKGKELCDALGIQQPVIGVAPGAQNSRAKQWPAERFVEAAGRLAEQLQAEVAVFGSATERPLGQAVAARLRQRGCPAINLAGETSLEDFMALASACCLFLSNDSGAMHLASVLDVPTVAVFGPTEWFATAPLGPRAVIVREPVECSPCMLRDCPADHRCMRRVSAARVVETALALLGGQSGNGYAGQDSAA